MREICLRNAETFAKLASDETKNDIYRLIASTMADAWREYAGRCS
jgi:hypothetical protein